MIVCPVTTSALDGRAWAIDRCTAALSAPGLATTSMKSNSPVSPTTRCAVGSVNAARVCSGEVVGGAELGDPGDGERLGGLQPGAQDPHLLADAEPVALAPSRRPSPRRRW